ncbi:GNAT family N-acetyltransferase [Tsuneonella sp. HG222]
MFYRSERLFLRPPFPEDSRAIHDGICDAGVVAMLSSAPWPYRMADAEQFCGRGMRPMEPTFIVTLPDAPGAPLVGAIGLQAKDEGAELGYWIARPYWGRGYATEAGKAVLDVARSLGIRKVLSGHFVDNPSSGRVLRKLGFAETGEVRPTFCRARGGELVLARRFAIELDPAGEACAADRMRTA